MVATYKIIQSIKITVINLILKLVIQKNFKLAAIYEKGL